MIRRTPFYGGVEYYDDETDKMSRAHYSPNQTESSAQKENELYIDFDELNIWSKSDAQVS